MTPADLSRLESLARKATPGPWFRPIANDTAVRSDDVDIAQTVGAYELEWERMEADAAYIAAANPAAVLALIERVRELEGKLEAIRDECDGKEDADDGIPNTAMRCMMIVEGTNKP